MKEAITMVETDSHIINFKKGSGMNVMDVLAKKTGVTTTYTAVPESNCVACHIKVASKLCQTVCGAACMQRHGGAKVHQFSTHAVIHWKRSEKVQEVTA